MGANCFSNAVSLNFKPLCDFFRVFASNIPGPDVEREGSTVRSSLIEWKPISLLNTVVYLSPSKLQWLRPAFSVFNRIKFVIGQDVPAAINVPLNPIFRL